MCFYISQVLDEEAEVFVVKMWRLLIYELEAKKLGLISKWKQFSFICIHIFLIWICLLLYHFPWICTTKITHFDKHLHYVTLRLNEEPQEHPLSAFGFVKILNAERISSDW